MRYLYQWSSFGWYSIWPIDGDPEVLDPDLDWMWPGWLGEAFAWTALSRNYKPVHLVPAEKWFKVDKDWVGYWY